MLRIQLDDEANILWKTVDALEWLKFFFNFSILKTTTIPTFLQKAKTSTPDGVHVIAIQLGIQIS